LRFEGLCDVSRRTHFARPRLVEGLESSSQQQHRNLCELGISLDGLADLVAVLAGHHDICEHDIGADFSGLDDRIVAVVDGQDGYVFAGETDRHDLLDRDAVVSQ